MIQAPYLLDQASRAIVLKSIGEVCSHRAWTLLAAHVRTNHVHAIVEAEVRPEKIMNDFKSYASRALNRRGPSQKHWARHGSTRWLWKDQEVLNAIRYVADDQGEPMSLFVANDTFIADSSEPRA